MEHGRLFFETYLNGSDKSLIVDLGSQDVNGSLRSVAPENCEYIGVDFAHGKGVDVVLDDPYTLPFADESIDAIVSSSCFEHSEFFWLTFLEALRVLKPNGLFYLNAPSNGWFHRYPVDCWRFYPDSGTALQNWGRRNSVDVLLLESFIGLQSTGTWNDFVAVFVKDRQHASRHPERIQSRVSGYMNGFVAGADGFSRLSVDQEDQISLCRKVRQFVLGRVLNMLE